MAVTEAAEQVVAIADMAAELVVAIADMAAAEHKITAGEVDQGPAAVLREVVELEEAATDPQDTAVVQVAHTTAVGEEIAVTTVVEGADRERATVATLTLLEATAATQVPPPKDRVSLNTAVEEQQAVAADLVVAQICTEAEVGTSVAAVQMVVWVGTLPVGHQAAEVEEARTQHKLFSSSNS